MHDGPPSVCTSHVSAMILKPPVIVDADFALSTNPRVTSLGRRKDLDLHRQCEPVICAERRRLRRWHTGPGRGSNVSSFVASGFLHRNDRRLHWQRCVCELSKVCAPAKVCVRALAKVYVRAPAKVCVCRLVKACVCAPGKGVCMRWQRCVCALAKVCVRALAKVCVCA